MDFKKTPCDVGMHLGKLRDYSKHYKNLRMPSGKRRMPSVSGRHNDEMHPTFFGRHPVLFIISDIYRVVTEFAEVHTDIARSFLEVH